MKVAYIPFNNKDFYTDHEVQRKTILKLLGLVQPHHLDPGEKGIVLLYLSKHANLIPVDFRDMFPWVETMIVVMDKKFSQDHGDTLAMQLANGTTQDVICMRPYPSVAVDDKDMEREREKEMDKWGWAYFISMNGELLGQKVVNSG